LEIDITASSRKAAQNTTPSKIHYLVLIFKFTKQILL